VSSSHPKSREYQLWIVSGRFNLLDWTRGRDLAKSSLGHQISGYMYMWMDKKLIPHSVTTCFSEYSIQYYT